MLKTIQTSKGAPAIGPYSQAICCNGLLFTSGQIPAAAENGEIVGTEIKAQAKQVMKNISAILEEAGVTFNHVIKTTCLLVITILQSLLLRTIHFLVMFLQRHMISQVCL